MKEQNIENEEEEAALNTTDTSTDYFADIYLVVDTTVRHKLVHWIRIFVAHGGVVLEQDDQHLATHVLHDGGEFKNFEKYDNAKHAVHVNVEWIKDTIREGCLQDDRFYRVTLLPAKTMDS